MDGGFPRHLDGARRLLFRWLRAGRRRSSLRTPIAILKAQQEATLDGILVVDTAGRVLSRNRRFLEIWGIPDNIAASGDDSELLRHAVSRVADEQSFLALVRHLYDHPEEVRSNDTVSMKDGSVLSR